MSSNNRSIFDRPLPPGYRKELQSLIAVEVPAPARRASTILLFRLGPLCLALPTRVASAVAPVLHIALIPHRSGTVLLGLAAFRGDIVPCCSLARILDVPQIQSGTARTLILEEAPGRLWAVPIDAALGVRIETGELAPADESAPLAAHWIRGTFAVEGSTYYLLDSDTLFRQITLATA